MRKRPGIEWVGGHYTLPATITGEGKPYHPEALFWMAEGLMLGCLLDRPGKVLSKASANLRKTAEQPLVGPAQHPSRVRVASPELAAILRQGHPELDVVCAPTPDLDSIVAQFSAGDAEAAQPYLPRGFAPNAVASFFRASAALFRAKPWKIVPADDSLVWVTAEDLGLHDALISVIGQMGQNFGFLVFPDVGAFYDYLDASEAVQNGDTPIIPPHIALELVPRSDVIPATLEEIRAQGWEVAGARAYPSILAFDADGPRTPTPGDMAVLEALSLALCQLLKSQRELTAAWSGGQPVKRTLQVATHSGDIMVSLATHSDDPAAGPDGDDAAGPGYRLQPDGKEIEVLFGTDSNGNAGSRAPNTSGSTDDAPRAGTSRSGRVAFGQRNPAQGDLFEPAPDEHPAPISYEVDTEVSSPPEGKSAPRRRAPVHAKTLPRAVPDFPVDEAFLPLPGSPERWIWALTCLDPDCPCRSVFVISAEGNRDAVHERTRALVDSWRGLQSYPDSAGGMVVFGMDIETLEIFTRTGEEARHRDEEPEIAAIIDRFDDELLDEIARLWLRGKGHPLPVDPGVGSAPIAIKGWEPGLMVGWDEVHPALRGEVYLDGLHLHAADELYCVNPRCDCEQTIVFFSPLQPPDGGGPGDIEITGAQVTLRPTREQDRPLLTRLWAAYCRRHPDYLARFAHRRMWMTEIGPRITAHRRPRVGRNQPCPCGSGKKYKKCCGTN